MKMRRIIAGITSAALIAAATTVFAAAENEAGYVAFTAIKSTIGQGFTVEPVMVPFYEGETGFDVVKRAADITYTESEYGAYITGFADSGDEEIILPNELESLVEITGGRYSEGYLSSYDYTAESGWSYFINGEYASVGIGDYIPADGDVLEFRYTIYGYGADLGIDNSSWGGAAAVTEQLNAASLITICANADDELKNTWNYVNGMELLAEYGVTQAEIDAVVDGINKGELAVIPEFPDEPAETAPETAEQTPDEETPAAEDTDKKGSPDTGVESVAIILGAAVIAAGAIAVSKKR